MTAPASFEDRVEARLADLRIERENQRVEVEAKRRLNLEEAPAPTAKPAVSSRRITTDARGAF